MCFLNIVQSIRLDENISGQEITSEAADGRTTHLIFTCLKINAAALAAYP
jgi:hypothetical protein